MDKYGFEHLRFSIGTYKQRKALIIIGCLSILIFEYHVTENLKIYDVNIPSNLIRLSLYLSASWTTIQFIFSSLDDYIDWKKNFLIDLSVRPKRLPPLGDDSLMIEIQSFSKGRIRYKHLVGAGYSRNLQKSESDQLNEALKSNMTRLEEALKKDIKSIESFKNWYRNYSWITIIRFSVIDFIVPILFIIYSVVICQFFPILPK